MSAGGILSGDDGPAYAATTRGVTVRVVCQFLPDQSEPASQRYVWAYTVEIENGGSEAVQLVARHWIITDGLNRTQEVSGPGVVGETPVIAPGGVYRYASACPLTTPSGSMRGTYRMVVTDSMTAFEADIPEFSLHLPQALRTVN